MNLAMDTSHQQTGGASPRTTSNSSSWPDLYALLGVSPGVDVEELRHHIRDAYIEAIQNSDHRSVEKRLHFQMMSQRIIPQARRILLEEKTRKAYDRQLSLHRKQDDRAVPYTSFVSQLTRIEAGDDPFLIPDGENATDAGEQPTANLTLLPSLSMEMKTTVATDEQREAARAMFDQAHDVLMSEQKYAEMAPIPALASEETTGKSLPGTGFVMDGESLASSGVTISTPNEASTQSNASRSNRLLPRSSEMSEPFPLTESSLQQEILPAEASDSSFVELVTLEMPSAPVSAPIAADATQVSPTNQKPESPTAEEPLEEPFELRATVLRVPRAADGTLDLNHPLPTEPQTQDPEEVRRAISGGMAELGEGVRGMVVSRRVDGNAHSTRVDVGKVNERAVNNQRFKHGQRVLSQTVLLAGMAFVGAGLALLIQYRIATAPVVARIPLRVMYASELQPVMEQAARTFEKSGEGGGTGINLQAVDARDAMQVALRTAGRRGGPNVWIPSESLWSDRFNEVASRYKQQSIATAQPLAVSPLVLIARPDRTKTLLRRFPNRTITSWSALRQAVIQDAPSRFGLTQPLKSGSGCIVRLFMAREWCRQNNVPWTAAAMSDPRLWNWMNGFEENVPGDARLTGDMVKDVALGSTDRYWWVIGYESDALRWMKKGKPVEVFYLPQTSYADHPLCRMDDNDPNQHTESAQIKFERFLRSPKMQKILAENGFRPTEISLSDVKNNPFSRPEYRKRGIRSSGFRVDGRINYRILNAMNVEWQKRY